MPRGCPGGGWAQVELTDALHDRCYTIETMDKDDSSLFSATAMLGQRLKPLETMPQQNCKCYNALNIEVTNRLAEHHLNAALLENGKVVIPFVPREGPGGPSPPLFFDQNEARRTKKKIFGDRPPPHPPHPPSPLLISGSG